MNCCKIRDDAHMISMRIVQFSGPPSLLPLVHLRAKFFHLLQLGRLQFQTNPPPSLFQNDDQSIKKSIIQGCLLYVMRSFLQVGFRFQYQLINIVWCLYDLFSLKPRYLLFRGFILLSVQLSKNITKCCLFTFLVLILQ